MQSIEQEWRYVTYWPLAFLPVFFFGSNVNLELPLVLLTICFSIYHALRSDSLSKKFESLIAAKETGEYFRFGLRYHRILFFCSAGAALLWLWESTNVLNINLNTWSFISCVVTINFVCFFIESYWSKKRWQAYMFERP